MKFQPKPVKTIPGVILLIIVFISACQQPQKADLHEIFQNPPESAKPWVLWYWIKEAVSEEGITTDLEAMKANGIGGAYLIPIQKAENPPLYEPVAETLSPQWWKLVRHAFKEAERLGLKFAIHSCDGFSAAGGPWITPETSMQKVVWADTILTGNQSFKKKLPQPEMQENYYNDIAVYAYPTHPDALFNTSSFKPHVTTNLTTEDLAFLADNNNTRQFKSSDEGWILYSFDAPFTCRNIRVNTKGNTIAAHRLIIEISNDGVQFDSICRLEPARHGWQDYEEDYVHAIPATTAKYFRFTYSRKGLEPGAEDLDAAKWSPRLKVQNIILSGNPVIHQYNSKNGSMWRIAKRTPASILNDADCIPSNSIVNLSDKVDSNGVLNWEVPEGVWTILRMGHTSTGHTNYIGGAGLGLECDKFDPDIVKLQFEQWFGRIYDSVENAPEVLKIFHMDSWECGSQNWSTVFPEEFNKRRGYNLLDYLPVIAGVPIKSTDFSEKVLFDIRLTIDELLQDNFFGTMANEALNKDCIFSCESISPVFVSDALKHYHVVDIPMGEFWFNSPTHDKPNDMIDAISGAHIYGKNIVQCEAYTTLRMDWNEHPAMLKTLGDRNFALGMNKTVFHVFTQNPWIDKKPGMTMNTVGLYFQPNQTWWKQGKAWIEYLQRCQALLQEGKPVVDIAVFTGEDIPSRGLTPDRLVKLLPGLFTEDQLIKNKIRLHNEGAPEKERPYSVTSSANTFDPANWIDPLNGYKYDNINRDALLKFASVKNGNIVLKGGMQYRLLVIPLTRKASPNAILSQESQQKILQLAREGATIILEPTTPMLPGNDPQETKINTDFLEILKQLKQEQCVTIGKGKIIAAPWLQKTLSELGIERDISFTEQNLAALNVDWAHRKGTDYDIYFISNQKNVTRIIDASFRVTGYTPELFNPETGQISELPVFSATDLCTTIPLKLTPNESVFIVFTKGKKPQLNQSKQNWQDYEIVQQISTPWTVNFDTSFGGPNRKIIFDALTEWTSNNNDSIKYYSGTASYINTFEIDKTENKTYYLNIGDISHIAEVIVNDQSCGIIWTHPHRVDITNTVKQGDNRLEIQVTNTWKNRVIGDHTVFKDQPFTFSTAPYRIKGQDLVPSGLYGPVTIEQIKN